MQAASSFGDTIRTITSSPAVGHAAAYAIAVAAVFFIGFFLFFWRRHRGQAEPQHLD